MTLREAATDVSPVVAGTEHYRFNAQRELFGSATRADERADRSAKLNRLLQMFSAKFRCPTGPPSGWGGDVVELLMCYSLIRKIVESV